MADSRKLTRDFQEFASFAKHIVAETAQQSANATFKFGRIGPGT